MRTGGGDRDGWQLRNQEKNKTAKKSNSYYPPLKKMHPSCYPGYPVTLTLSLPSNACFSSSQSPYVTWMTCPLPSPLTVLILMSYSVLYSPPWLERNGSEARGSCNLRKDFFPSPPTKALKLLDKLKSKLLARFTLFTAKYRTCNHYEKLLQKQFKWEFQRCHH